MGALTSVAAPIWNEIAETQKLKTEWAKKAFRLDAMELAELESREYRELKAANGEELASAVVRMKPFLLENEAISRYTQAHPNLRAALPEVVSISEAVMLASLDSPLSRPQQTKLHELLQAEFSKNRPG